MEEPKEKDDYDDSKGRVDGDAGSLSGPEGAGSLSGPKSAGSLSGPEVAGSLSGPEGDGSLSGPKSAGSLSGPEGDGPPSGPEGAVGPADNNNTREESPAAEGAPQVEGASKYSTQATVASTSHRDLGSPLPEFTLTVPFLSYLEAEVVRGYLLAGAETHHGRVRWALTVTGCDLFIRLTSEDPDLLQVSTASLLGRLSIVVQIMQHFVPPFCMRHQFQNGF